MKGMKLINGITVEIEKVISRNEVQRVIVCDEEKRIGMEIIFDENQIGFTSCFEERIRSEQITLKFKEAFQIYQINRDSEKWCEEIMKRYPHAFANFFMKNAKNVFNVTSERKYIEVTLLELLIQTIRKDKIIPFARMVKYEELDKRSADEIKEIKNMFLEKVPPRLEREFLELALSPW